MPRSWARASEADAERLLAAVDAGIPAAMAARALGLTRGQTAGVLHRAGRALGRSRTVITEDHRRRVRVAFAEHGTFKAAGAAAGLSAGAAGRILAKSGLASAFPGPTGKPAARSRA